MLGVQVKIKVLAARKGFIAAPTEPFPAMKSQLMVIPLAATTKELVGVAAIFIGADVGL